MSEATAVRKRYPVGRVSDFADGVIKVVEVGRRMVCVVRAGDDIRAFQDRCPHQGAALSGGELTGTMIASTPGTYEYGLEGRVIRCPWHRWEFSIDDGCSVGRVTRKRVVTYEVEIDDGEVHVLAR